MTTASVTGILKGMTAQEQATGTPRNAGRPRSTEADRAIVQTTLRLMVEQGYDAMSVEGVAAAAGVGKTTIYRRYPSKRELVIAAVSSIADELEPSTDSGDVRTDLLNFLLQQFDVFRTGIAFSLLGTMLVKEREDPLLIELFRRQVLYPRMEIARGLLRRGIERGQLRSDFPVDVAVQMLAGSIFARHIAGQPETDEWLQSVLDTLLRGLTPK